MRMDIFVYKLYLCKGMHSQSTYPILRSTYPNNFLFFGGKQLRKCLAYVMD